MASLWIRPLETTDEFEAGVELQKTTWGHEFDDVVSGALMRVSAKIGGVSAGAFDDDALVGMIFGLTGIRGDERVHWSHMLAVEPGWQGRGLGTILKAYQRRIVMRLGVRKMFWTFDPLEARNAHFNINRLGARTDSYVENMYGSGETSPLHRGIGTDRLVAAWMLEDAAVTERMSEVERALDYNGDVAAVHVENAGAAQGRRRPDAHVRIEIPANIQGLKRKAPHEAAEWRMRTRAAFNEHFAAGLTVSAFERDADTGRCFYLLTPSNAPR